MQATWQRFGVKQDVARQLPALQQLNSRHDRGQLVQLLRAHQLGLNLEGETHPWGQAELADALWGLRQQHALIQKAIETRQELVRWMQISAGAALALMIVTWVSSGDELSLQSLALVACTAIIALWLCRPLPLGNRERLRRHQRALEAELPELDRMLAGSTLADANLRAAVVGSVQRIGSEVMDLSKDALEATAWNWMIRP